MDIMDTRVEGTDNDGEGTVMVRLSVLICCECSDMLRVSDGDEITDEWNIPCVLQGDCIPEQANVQRQHRFMERCQCY